MHPCIVGLMAHYCAVRDLERLLFALSPLMNRLPFCTILDLHFSLTLRLVFYIHQCHIRFSEPDRTRDYLVNLTEREIHDQNNCHLFLQYTFVRKQYYSSNTLAMAILCNLVLFFGKVCTSLADVKFEYQGRSAFQAY